MIRFAIGALGFGALGLGGLALFSEVTARRIERVLPPRGRFVEVAGARLHYVDRGTGPAIVMVHGLGGQLGNFTHSLLGRLVGDFRVIAVERPGSGHSTRPRAASARLRAQGETIAAFIKALGLERPLVVGHSLGGAIALAVALDHPELVGGLALVAPLTHPPERMLNVFRPLAIRSPALRRVAAQTLAVPLSMLSGRAVMGTVFGPDVPPPDFRVAGGGALALRPKSFYAASTDFVAASHDLPAMMARYASLTLPVGVLFGTGDRILDPAVHGDALAARIPHLTLSMIPGGHMLPLTAPDETEAFIRTMAARVADG